MKIRFMFSVLITIFFVTNFANAGEKIKITNGEWPPYLSQNLKHYGLASRIVTESFSMEGIDVEYGFFPWARAYKLAKDGQWDASAVWTPNEERKEFFLFSNSVIDDVTVFFHLKTLDFKWKTMDDLKKFRIGATLEYNYGEMFTKAEKDGIIKVDRVAADETSFKKLLINRIQLFVCNLEVGYSLLYKMYPPETVSLFTNNPESVHTASLSLIISNKIPKGNFFLEKFNKGLKKLKDSGKIDQYIQESREGKYKK